MKRLLFSCLFAFLSVVITVLLTTDTQPGTFTVQHLLSAIIFYTAIPLSAADRVKKGRTAEMIIFSLLIIALQVSLLSDSSLFIGMMFAGYGYLNFIASITGMLTIILFRQFIKTEEKNNYLLLAGLSYLILPYLMENMKLTDIFSPNFGRHSTLLISWQFLTGISLSLLIWLYRLKGKE